MTATPSAPETMRATVFVADATPDLAAGTAPTTASVAGAMTQPMARVTPRNQATSQSTLVFGPQSSVNASGRAVQARPAATTRAVPRRRTALLDVAAPTISPSVIGLITAPALMAL